MVSDDAKQVIGLAKVAYSKHRSKLESEHQGKFVAIEPESGVSMPAGAGRISSLATATVPPADPPCGTRCGTS